MVVIEQTHKKVIKKLKIIKETVTTRTHIFTNICFIFKKACDL